MAEKKLSLIEEDRGYGNGVTLRALFCSGYGSLAQVTLCSFAALSIFVAVLVLRCGSATAWSATLRPNNFAKSALLVRYRVTRASDWNQVVKQEGGIPLPPTEEKGSVVRKSRQENVLT